LIELLKLAVNILSGFFAMLSTFRFSTSQALCNSLLSRFIQVVAHLLSQQVISEGDGLKTARLVNEGTASHQ
jgi:hypothetical protein